MKSRIIAEFIGEINGVEIDSEWIYHSCKYILTLIEEKFGECYNEKFIKDLMSALDIIYFKYEDISISDIENEFEESINNAPSFETLNLKIYGEDYRFDFLNNNRSLHFA